ncbi:MAG: hypothetical protein GXP49_12410 [Deltaproteobacteria bacterium]|nr:hypothetical protein [Deltaproteobacteria bacterium]
MKVVHEIGFNPPKDVQDHGEHLDMNINDNSPTDVSRAAIVDLKGAERVDALVKQTMEMRGSKKQRVDKIKMEIQAGKYRPNPEAAARGIIEEALFFDSLLNQ